PSRWGRSRLIPVRSGAAIAAPAAALRCGTRGVAVKPSALSIWHVGAWGRLWFAGTEVFTDVIERCYGQRLYSKGNPCRAHGCARYYLELPFGYCGLCRTPSFVRNSHLGFSIRH